MSATELVQPRARRYVSPSRRSRPQIDRACDDRMPSNESEYVARSSFRLLLIKDRVHQILWHLFEMRRLHRITGAAFRKGTNGSSVTEHFRKRHLGVHDCQIAARFDAVDAGTTPIQIADDVALIFFGGDVFHLHNGFEQNWLPLLNAIFDGEDCGHFESEFI